MIRSRPMHKTISRLTYNCAMCVTWHIGRCNGGKENCTEFIKLTDSDIDMLIRIARHHHA